MGANSTMFLEFGPWVGGWHEGYGAVGYQGDWSVMRIPRYEPTQRNERGLEVLYGYDPKPEEVACCRRTRS